MGNLIPSLLSIKFVLFGWILDVASGQCKESLRMESIPFYAIITITSVMELNR